MTALTLDQEFGRMRLRFRRTLTASIGLHVLLLLVLLAGRHATPLDVGVVEVTWLDQVPRPQPVDEVVPERQPRPTVKEKLAVDSAAAERVRRRLSDRRSSSIADRAAAALPASADLLNTAEATMAPLVRQAPPADLNRGATPGGPAVALTRGPAASHRTVALVADLAAGDAGTGTAAVARPEADSAAVRQLGGAVLKGAVADRAVLTHPMPQYPAWATTQAVEATVTLYFLVTPKGLVRENVQVQTTAGYQDFDDNAMTALRRWRFEPLTGSDAREQWGTISFRYRLDD